MLLHQHSSQCPSQLNHLASFPQAESSDLIGLTPNSTLHTAGHTAKACWDIWTSLESSTAYWYSFYGCFSFFFFFWGYLVYYTLQDYDLFSSFFTFIHPFIRLFSLFFSCLCFSLCWWAAEVGDDELINNSTIQCDKVMVLCKRRSLI